MAHTAPISLNDNDPAGDRKVDPSLLRCARSRPPERAQVLPSAQLQIHRPSLILLLFLFPSHPPSLNQASLCFQIGLSFSLGARSLAVGSNGRSSDGLALISRIVLSLEPLCAFSSYYRKKTKKTLIGIQHWALIPRVHHRSIGFGGRRILDTDPHCGSSGSFKHHKGASGNGSSKHHLRVLFTHGHTVTGIKEHSEIIQPDAVEHIRS